VKRPVSRTTEAITEEVSAALSAVAKAGTGATEHNGRSDGRSSRWAEHRVALAGLTVDNRPPEHLFPRFDSG
jgi:hypothetical protein